MSGLDRYPLVINPDQAFALSELMRGRLQGTRYPDIEPPTSVAIGAIDTLNSGVLGTEDPAHTLGVVDGRGRCWQIVTAGITWPIGAEKGHA